MSDERTVETDPANKAEPGSGESVEALWESIEQDEAGHKGDPAPPTEADKLDDPPAKTPSEEAPAKDEPPASQAEDDLWKAAPPELREAHERALAAERTRAEQAETTVRRHSGRLTQTSAELQATRDELAKVRAGGKETDSDSALSDEEKAKLREEYPDSVAKVLTYAERLESRIETLQQEQTASTTARTEEQLGEQLTYLEGQHADWYDVVRSNEFKAWAQTAPGYVQDGIRANSQHIVDGAGAADIISRFKTETAPDPDPARDAHEEKRREQMEASQRVDTTRPSAAAKPKATDTEAIWKELDEEDRRAASGRR